MTETDKFRANVTVLLEQRIRNMRRLDAKTWIDASLITHTEYQLFLNEMYLQGKYYQPDHWQAKQFPIGKDEYPILGIRPSDAVAFCNWLTIRDFGKFRLPNQSEIDDMNSSTPGFWLINNKKEITYYGNYLSEEVISHVISLYSRTLASDPTLSWAFSKTVDLAFALDIHPSYDVNLSYYLNLDFLLVIVTALDHYFNLQESRELKTYITYVLDRGHMSTFEPINFDPNDVENQINKVVSSLALLSLRREGLLPAFEGILLVREQG